MESFEVNFQKIEELIYSAGFSPNLAGPVGSARTSATISQPIAHVFSETVVTLEKQALRMALQNAKAEFKELMNEGCGLESFKIAATEEPSPHANLPNPYAGTRGTPPSHLPNGAPVAFPDIWVTKALDVTFDFNSGQCN